MIRPEVLILLRKYTELGASLAFGCVGLWVLSWGSWFWQAIGVIIILASAGLTSTAVRRMRFQTDQIGPGVVEVDERQISYFSAYEGGTVSLNQLVRITILTNSEGPWADDVHWLFEDDSGAMLTIPNSASGASQIFDALSALDGVDFVTAGKAMGGTDNDSYVIWSKPRTALH